MPRLGIRDIEFENGVEVWGMVDDCISRTQTY